MAQGNINNKYEILLIGGSAGSLDVLLKLLPHIRKDLDIAIVIVLHRSNSDSLLNEVLRERITWPVIEAEEKEKIQPGSIYLAPADYHLLIEKNYTFSLDYSEKINYSRPAIDVTFETAAEAYGGAAVALLLSGANADGSKGLLSIKTKGGMTLVQDPAEASVAFMPEQAIELLKVDYVAKTPQIVEIINRVNRES